MRVVLLHEAWRPNSPCACLSWPSPARTESLPAARRVFFPVIVVSVFSPRLLSRRCLTRDGEGEQAPRVLHAHRGGRFASGVESFVISLGLRVELREERAPLPKGGAGLQPQRSTTTRERGWGGEVVGARTSPASIGLGNLFALNKYMQRQAPGQGG